MLPDRAEALFDDLSLNDDARRSFMAFDQLLTETQTHTNLVARNGYEHRWDRHYRDSTQLFSLIPLDTASLLDIGSGGGFPGLPLAILAQSKLPSCKLTLCESIGKKAAFLQKAGEAAGLSNVTVRHGRVEAMPPDARFDVVTARAVTALTKLLALAVPRLKSDGIMILPKGRGVQRELDEALEQWSFEFETVPSHTDDEARILIIRSATRKT
ncbi:MAG: 16S rRNA (guanine(527)-N(7))-methyltransferase RsmG [Parvularculaceae bacterium]|nr:16S rRNA (guanine(527)-N(7))-methyltransferase RsmG [Parvularculaceae bacterium]